MAIHILGQTGPRSIKGKAISSMNALKSGAYAKTKVLPHEDADERKKLEREMYKALKPKGSVEESLVDQMIDSLWTSERFKLRLVLRQSNIFSQLMPSTLAELIEAPIDYCSFAPDYLKETNTRFSKADIALASQRYKQYEHLCKHSKGIQNYQMVFASYKDLFQGAHEFIGGSYQQALIMETGAGLGIAWQQNPRKLEEVLLKYAASLWYMIHFDELRPHIRHATATWFFLDRQTRKESDYQDDMVNRELNRYKTLLDTFMKFRKSQADLGYLEKQATPKRNQFNETKWQILSLNQ